MDKIMFRWFNEDAVLLGVWCLLEKTEDTKVKTVALDTRSTIISLRYNPEYLDKLKEEQLELILVSECFKVLLKHPTTRLKQPPQVSSMSSQITINDSILNKFPFEKSEEYFISPQGLKLESDKWYEYYFEKIMENLDDITKKLSKIFKDNKELLAEYMNPENQNNEYWAENDLFDADVKHMVDEHKHSMKNWGTYTGDMMGKIVAANSPKISYKEIIRRFRNSIMTTKTSSSRMKVNRRYDLAQPGKKREYTTKIIFAVDSSGSMSDDDLREGFAVINSVCKHAELEYVLFDTKITLTEKKFKNAKKSFKIAGRGGTDFTEVCEYAQNKKVDGLVIYTDGEAPPPQPKGTKVLWLLTDGNKKPPTNFGQVAVLDRFENVH